ncbi:MAG TPA: hypothetical protein ENI51_07930 [Candidatus Atribacteria bacterium]|nr:hypothetical protein [Candidatus Atribacteria bacterium]
MRSKIIKKDIYSIYKNEVLSVINVIAKCSPDTLITLSLLKEYMRVPDDDYEREHFYHKALRELEKKEVILHLGSGYYKIIQKEIREDPKEESSKKSKKRACEYCGRYIISKRFTFYNICQDPPEHYFCSKRCKENWIYDLQKLNKVLE